MDQVRRRKRVFDNPAVRTQEFTHTYQSEQDKSETINTIEEAKRVIIATATSRELSREELMVDNDITAVANTFGINIDSLSIERSIDPNDFFYTYSFNE